MNKWKKIVLLAINSVTCNFVDSEFRNKSADILISDILNSLMRPSVLLTSDPGLDFPISSRSIIFIFSESFWLSNLKEKIKLTTKNSDPISDFSIEQTSNNQIKLVFSNGFPGGDYNIDFSNLSSDFGKPIIPESLTFTYDPSSPLVSSSIGEILDSSIFINGYLDLVFNESVVNADILDNYRLEGTALGSLKLSSVAKIKTNLYRLFYTGLPSVNGGNLTIIINNVKDNAGNFFSEGKIEFKVYGFKMAGNLNNARHRASVVLLQSGEILLTGGETISGVSNAAEIYNPITKASRSIGNLINARQRHTSTLLSDGRVFIAGGDKNLTLNATDSINTTEIFDPSTERFSAGPLLSRPRMDHSAILLKSGSILVAGGMEIENSSPFRSISDFDIYNPSTNRISFTGKMNFERRNFVLQRLSDGEVYAFGGRRQIFSPGAFISETEKFDESNQTFNIQTNYTLNFSRSNFFVSEISVGKLLIYGDTLSSEYYDPIVGSLAINSNLSRPRFNASSVMFPNGKIILFGGDADGGYVSRIDYYDPQTNRFTIGNRMLFPRIGVSSVLLSSGRVILLGGKAANLVSEVEEYSNE